MANERVATVGAMDVSSVAELVPRKEYFNNWRFYLYCILISLFYGACMLYQRAFAITKGIDYTSQDFQTYWMNLFWGITIMNVIIWGLTWGWIWFVYRDRHLEQLSPGEELKRWYSNWLITLGVYAWCLVWAVFFVEQDGVWHSSMIRDTEFTPSHIFNFYLSWPIFINFGVAGLMLTRTRLPVMGKKWLLPLVMEVAWPIMFIPLIGENEWGHSAWILEEWFAAPLHWTFVPFAWAAVWFLGNGFDMFPRIAAVLKATYFGEKCMSAAEAMENPEEATNPVHTLPGM
ncbi:methane monooxygenase [Methylacidiphilum kamchatkense Kam1]|uniref:Methane monooxygenase n=2 Tax=Methylacidiphilum kamchatkense TaxID=431057 RepID=A0A0C1RN26_9BACT|nr:methane monooxygenase/ammonia monooxygenase subunit C [Methylacidiphilum kamchatkense]AFC75746.1 PmoC3 [Methylacidiphilum kamchatkense Kam1]KIE59427.1 methane monooxygenase [Methylacidiphilum kamchatkense Kam1]QDQ42585.1 methane/ammonia monooxygenase subunit C [Methylacidiphilum kamchatkense Kam1]